MHQLGESFIVFLAAMRVMMTKQIDFAAENIWRGGRVWDEMIVWGEREWAGSDPTWKVRGSRAEEKED